MGGGPAILPACIFTSLMHNLCDLCCIAQSLQHPCCLLENMSGAHPPSAHAAPFISNADEYAVFNLSHSVTDYWELLNERCPDLYISYAPGTQSNYGAISEAIRKLFLKEIDSPTESFPDFFKAPLGVRLIAFYYFVAPHEMNVATSERGWQTLKQAWNSRLQQGGEEKLWHDLSLKYGFSYPHLNTLCPPNSNNFILSGEDGYALEGGRKRRRSAKGRFSSKARRESKGFSGSKARRRSRRRSKSRRRSSAKTR